MSQGPDHCLEVSQRPWGDYVVVVDEPDHKVKRITVSAGRRLSLQRHQRRMEHWYFIAGEAHGPCYPWTSNLPLTSR